MIKRIEYIISDKSLKDIEEHGQYFYMENSEIKKELTSSHIILDLINRTIVVNNDSFIVTGIVGEFNNIRFQLMNKVSKDIIEVKYEKFIEML